MKDLKVYQALCAVSLNKPAKIISSLNLNENKKEVYTSYEKRKS